MMKLFFLKKIAIIDHHVGYQSGECRDRKEMKNKEEALC